MLTVAFGECTVNRTQVQLWCKRFKKGREDVNDDAYPGRPSTSKSDENINAVKKMILNKRRITIREIANDVGISFSSCQAIFMNVLVTKRSAVKIAPKLLNVDNVQRQSRFAQTGYNW